jgi:hypothetical protein
MNFATFHTLIKPYTRREGSDELVSYKEDAMAVNGLTQLKRNSRKVLMLRSQQSNYTNSLYNMVYEIIGQIQSILIFLELNITSKIHVSGFDSINK